MQIRNAKQEEFPNSGTDKKIRLIRKLKALNSGPTCDSLKAIFLSFDTAIRGYWEYKYAPLYILADFHTPKSLSVLADIIRHYPLDFPANMYFIWNLVYDTKDIAVMFPDLSYSLGRQKWTDLQVLMIIIAANRKGDLAREQLESSKENLLKFYERLKIERDSLPGAWHYASYYETHLTELIQCFRIFSPDERINKIYYEILKDNAAFARFCTVSFAEYHNKSKRKLRALSGAALGLIQNDQPVEQKYLETIVAEPLYHNAFYEELVRLKKETLFPSKYLTRELFALSDIATAKENRRDEGLPDCLEFLGSREIATGTNKGVYFFYNAVREGGQKEIILAVSGPQPLEQPGFISRAKMTNKITVLKFTRDKTEGEINKIIAKLAE